MNKLEYLLFLLLIVIIFPTQSLADHYGTSASYSPPGYRIRTVVIDAGHGGHAGSTRGKFSREKDVALQVALTLGKAIEKEMKDVKVIYTRETDVFVKLYERIAVANDNKADIFISIHSNSMPITMRGQNTSFLGT